MVLSIRLKVLLGLAAAASAYVLFSAPTPSTEPETVQADTTVHPGRNPTSRISLITEPAHDAGGLLARLTHRVSGGKNIDALFHSQSWYVAPPPPPPAPVEVVAPPPPTAPPLPFSVMGSYARPGERTVYFLTRADRVFDIHVGDTIDNLYSVDSATDSQLTLTYKPLNIQQTLAFGDSK